MWIEALQIQRPTPTLHPYLMNSISSTFRSTLVFTSVKLRCFSAVSSPNSTTTQDLTLVPTRKKGVSSSKNGRGGVRVSDSQLKEKWLDSLTCPFPEDLLRPNCGVSGVLRSDLDSQWVIGVDPDVSGALALLKNDDLGCSPQVFDSPHLQLLVGKRTRRRLDAKSIVQLLRSIDAPVGTTAYVEQSIPYPQDGKQVSKINISRNCNCFSLLGITTASQLSFFVNITMVVAINAATAGKPKTPSKFNGHVYFKTCGCGTRAAVRISESERNPGRLFYGCPKEKNEKEKCSYWREWCNPVGYHQPMPNVVEDEEVVNEVNLKKINARVEVIQVVVDKLKNRVTVFKFIISLALIILLLK